MLISKYIDDSLCVQCLVGVNHILKIPFQVLQHLQAFKTVEMKQSAYTTETDQVEHDSHQNNGAHIIVNETFTLCT